MHYRTCSTGVHDNVYVQLQVYYMYTQLQVYDNVYPTICNGNKVKSNFNPINQLEIV